MLNTRRQTRKSCITGGRLNFSSVAIAKNDLLAAPRETKQSAQDKSKEITLKGLYTVDICPNARLLEEREKITKTQII